ncbi:AbrB/MazE/SpoVT family DNA-binding domain-containing protein [Arthrobacter sp. 35/47]|uniref:AbrB/MazE/SpoVT family DNA-binding domain-containing protein n=1 Tax=Arthrobacter sp. 35/47 TaxID=269454 RepID=UPI00047E9678|nr:AbrB/MazE/SpoVT family DNA-binding domain-containing protein [Arthrobacter sp. 35/47]
MAIARVSSRGRLTLPLEVRLRLAIEPGTKVNFVFTSDGRCVMEPVGAPLKSLEGVFHQAGAKPRSLNDMDSAIGAEAAKNVIP